MEDDMNNAKKNLIRFIRKLPADFRKEDIIMAIVTEDLREKGFTDADFEEIRDAGIYPEKGSASH